MGDWRLGHLRCLPKQQGNEDHPLVCIPFAAARAKGPSRTKITKESDFGMGSAFATVVTKYYGEGSENACFSRRVRPRQRTEICNFWEYLPLDFSIFSSGFFPSSPGFCVMYVVRKSPQNVEKIARFPGGERSVESYHVMVFSVPSFAKEKGSEMAQSQNLQL